MRGRFGRAVEWDLILVDMGMHRVGYILGMMYKILGTGDGIRGICWYVDESVYVFIRVV